MIRRVGAAAAGLALVALLLHLAPATRPGAHQLAALRDALPYVSAAVVLVQLLPERAQPFLLALAAGSIQLAWGGPTALAWRAGAVVAVAILAAVLPLHDTRVRRATILGGVLAWPLIVVADLPSQLVGPSVQLVFVAAMTDGLPLRQGLRHGLACSMLPTISVPPAESLRVDRTPRGVLLGAARGVIGLATPTRWSPFSWIPTSDPWFALWSGQVWRVPDLAIAVTLANWPPVLGRLLAVAGMLRLLGVPMTAPVDAPWLASDFLEWWRRTHTWRSRLFREAFFLRLGWTGPTTVLLVFLLSGLQHVAAGNPIDDMLRWTLDGAISAATFVVLRRRAASRARLWVEKRERRRVSPWIGRVLVLIGQGLLWALVA